MFETLLGEATHFAANIEFLRQHDLGKLFGHLVQADRKLRTKETNDMIITQTQLDTLNKTDQQLADAVAAAAVRAAQAQTAAQATTLDLAAAHDDITALQAQLIASGTPVDLSHIFDSLTSATSKVSGIDVTLAPTTGSTPAVAVGDTVTVPTDPTDPTSQTADHTVTQVGEDGATTTEPVDTTQASDTTQAADASTGGTGAGDTALGDAAATS